LRARVAIGRDIGTLAEFADCDFAPVGKVRQASEHLLNAEFVVWDRLVSCGDLQGKARATDESNTRAKAELTRGVIDYCTQARITSGLCVSLAHVFTESETPKANAALRAIAYDWRLGTAGFLFGGLCVVLLLAVMWRLATLPGMPKGGDSSKSGKGDGEPQE
jgi:hypothetical protein